VLRKKRDKEKQMYFLKSSQASRRYTRISEPHPCMRHHVRPAERPAQPYELARTSPPQRSAEEARTAKDPVMTPREEAIGLFERLSAAPEFAIHRRQSGLSLATRLL
jgi:hypothetical protein